MVSSECLLWYCDLFTTETEELSFFHQLGRWPHFTLFLMLVWWHKSRYKINYSYFFRGDWRGVLQWCNVRAHKIIISACTIDFRPTLTYESTSADLQQQHLTSFCAVCGILFYYKRENTVVSSGVRDVMLVTYICSSSAECLYATFCDQTWYCGAPPWARMSCKKKRGFYLQGQGHSTGLFECRSSPDQVSVTHLSPPLQITLKGEKKKKKKNIRKRKGKSQTGHWADCSCIFGVFCNTRDTDLRHNIMHS